MKCVPNAKAQRGCRWCAVCFSCLYVCSSITSHLDYKLLWQRTSSCHVLDAKCKMVRLNPGGQQWWQWRQRLVVSQRHKHRTDQIMIMIKYHPFQSDIKQAEGKLFLPAFHRHTRRRLRRHRRRRITLTLHFFRPKIMFSASNLTTHCCCCCLFPRVLFIYLLLLAPFAAADKCQLHFVCVL